MACGMWYTAHGMLWEDRQTLIPEGFVSKLVLSPHISQSEGNCLFEPSFPYSWGRRTHHKTSSTLTGTFGKLIGYVVLEKLCFFTRAQHFMHLSVVWLFRVVSQPQILIPAPMMGPLDMSSHNRQAARGRARVYLQQGGSWQIAGPVFVEKRKEGML